ncbi:unnamed protein product [Clavelina lepadiformis]|uniref:chitinase n=1 Tax=Clavelina lepadiformis TaxID=159417 RepID=A0ABP0H5N7_CLALP
MIVSSSIFLLLASTALASAEGKKVAIEVSCGPDSPIYGNKGDCIHFYQCSGDVLYQFTCPDNQAFDPIHLTCTWPNSVEGCEHVDGIGAEETYCKGNNVPIKPFLKPGTCDVYYECLGGKIYETRCVSGLCFNPETYQCDWPQDVAPCVPGTTQLPPIYATTTNSPDVISETDELPSHDGHVTTTIKAQTPGNNKTQSPEYKEDTSKPSCKDINGNPITTGKFAKPGECDTFYQCVDEILTETSCPEGLNFNPETLTCDLAENVDCELTVITMTSSDGKSTTAENKPSPVTSTRKVPETRATKIPPKTTIFTPPQTTTNTTIVTPTTEKQGDTFVGFVVHDTGSMSNEIIAVKEWIRNCVDGRYDQCATEPSGGWVITSFNDPDTKTVVGPTTNINDVINFIDHLSADEGGDCPEYSMTGIKSVGDVIPTDNGGCKVYFFTDAIAKDSRYADDVHQVYLKKKCVFIPMLTGCCGTCADPCISTQPEYCINFVTDGRDTSKRKRRDATSYSTSSDESIYYQLASNTGGRIYLTDKPSSPVDFLEFLEDEVTLGFCPTDLIAGPLSLGYTNEEHCNISGSCWDRSVSKCYCMSATEPCPHYEILAKTECPKTGQVLLPVPNDCSSYYHCNEGVKWERPCAERTVFDPKVGVCNHPWKVTGKCGTPIA